MSILGVKCIKFALIREFMAKNLTFTSIPYWTLHHYLNLTPHTIFSALTHLSNFNKFVIYLTPKCFLQNKTCPAG